MTEHVVQRIIRPPSRVRIYYFEYERIDRSVVISVTLISSTNKTDRHDITEILSRVVLNTIPPLFTSVVDDVMIVS